MNTTCKRFLHMMQDGNGPAEPVDRNPMPVTWFVEDEGFASQVAGICAHLYEIRRGIVDGNMRYCIRSLAQDHVTVRRELQFAILGDGRVRLYRHWVAVSGNAATGVMFAPMEFIFYVRHLFPIDDGVLIVREGKWKWLYAISRRCEQRGKVIFQVNGPMGVPTRRPHTLYFTLRHRTSGEARFFCMDVWDVDRVMWFPRFNDDESIAQEVGVNKPELYRMMDDFEASAPDRQSRGPAGDTPVQEPS